MRNLTVREGPGKIRSFSEQKIYQTKLKKDKSGLVYAVLEEGNLKIRVRVFHRNHLLSCEQFPAFTEGKNYRWQQKQEQHFNKETVNTWDSSGNSDADLSQRITAIHTHNQKVSRRVIKKQQQQERSLEQPLPSRK